MKKKYKIKFDVLYFYCNYIFVIISTAKIRQRQGLMWRGGCWGRRATGLGA
jgi:hypothetical protein